jgi:hypothetical protein
VREAEGKRAALGPVSAGLGAEAPVSIQLPPPSGVGKTSVEEVNVSMPSVKHASPAISPWLDT